MPIQSITGTTAEINLKLNTITRKQDDEIKKAVAALPETKPPATLQGTSQAVKGQIPVQSSSALPKG